MKSLTMLVFSLCLGATILSHGAKRAWQQDNPYRPPDFDKFFPDDPDGGKKLDELWKSKGLSKLSSKEQFEAVKNGLRRTSQHRTLILRWLGNRYIWNRSPQNPDAIEIMYHATDFSGAKADPYGTRHYAVYFGLSVVKQKSPAILRTLAELCIKVDDPNDLHRVAWGAKSQREELIFYLKPALESDDKEIRKKAELCKLIFQGKQDAFAWAGQQAKLRAQKKYGDKLPEIKKVLLTGDSKQRYGMLNEIMRERILLIMDNSFIKALEACSADPNEKVRRSSARLIGNRYVWGSKEPSAEAITLLIKISKDNDHNVRYNAVYYGLSTINNADDTVLTRLVEMGLEDREPNLYNRIIWNLRRNKARASVLLEKYITDKTSDRAKAAVVMYKTVTGKEYRQAGK